MGVIVDLAGICVGNTLWLVGLVVMGVGLWLVRANQEKVMKLVGMLSILSAGQPQGLADKLTHLVQPRDRTTAVGAITLLIGIGLAAVGCYLLKVCG
jgi:uncharacterized membrane protein YiaA